MGKKVLTVDDDTDIITFIKAVLDKNGYTPIVARTGEEGLQKVKEENPDLIILDVLMPEEGGINMYRELKLNSTYSTIPVIILSGISKQVFLKSQDALTQFDGNNIPEPEAYLEKPAKPELLEKTIKDFL